MAARHRMNHFLEVRTFVIWYHPYEFICFNGDLAS